MNLQLWTRKAVSAFVLAAIFTTSSTVALAGSGRVAAELTVNGKTVTGDEAVVLVNGEPAKSGRSIFSSTAISTPEDATAAVSIGKTGRLELGPNTSLNLIFDESSVDAELTSGKLTVTGSLGTVKVRTNDGKTTILQAGDSISASGQTQAGRQSSSGSENWWIWVAVGAGVAAAVLIAVAASSNDDPVVSPNR